LQDHLPWLCQGDIFADAPVIDVILSDTNELQVSLPMGPAVLITPDCAMDKPGRSGRPRVERLQFVRLRAVDALPLGQQNSLRGSRSKLGPYEALYLGDVADYGESFILLSDSYYLPAAYFALGFEDYSDHAQGGPDARYVTLSLHDTRLGCLDTEQVELLRRKLIAFWARVTE
jgi:hypothetical protein